MNSKYNINVVGNNIRRFIKRLKTNNIDLLNIKYINDNEANIIVYKKDYDKILEIKTIYKIKIINSYGIVNIKNNLFESKYIIIFVLLGILSVYILSNMIFSIDIITNDNSFKEQLLSELENEGIKKYSFKKDYSKLNDIKTKILKKYNTEIEWIEIERFGTKYIVRYVPRVVTKKVKEKEYRNIVAKKDAVISSLSVSSGQIIKDVNSYVKKGDIIVSGYIYLNENVKDVKEATGKVYGETWYEISVTYPYKYYESKYTGESKKIVLVKFLNNNIELLNFNKYKNKKVFNKTLIRNNMLPIKLIYQTQKEMIVIKENNTEEELIKKAIDYSINKIKIKLKKDEYIKNYKVLSKRKNKESITLNLFFSIVEDIGEYEKISLENEVSE